MSKNLVFLGLLCFLLIQFTLQSSAQLPDSWTQKSNTGGNTRFGAVSFNIGGKGYMGLGSGGDSAKEFWEYDPITDSWSQKADFGGSAILYAAGFSIGTKGYVGTGQDVNTRVKDFWEFDAVSNIWTQKADFGGLERSNATGFSIGSKGYIGTGLINSTTRVNDFWEYDPALDTWSQKSNVGGLVRAYAAGFSIGGKGYIGTGNSGLLLKDFWEYDPTTDVWVRKADFGGASRFQSVGLSAGTNGYIGLGDVGGGYTNDFWEYNPAMDTWTQRTNFGGEVRGLAISFSISNKVFVGTGYNAITSTRYNDFWEYTPCVQPAITAEPGNKSINYGNPASFIVAASDTVTYQWQEDAGSGFVDISNGGIYSNTANDTLNISLPTVAMTGYKYRCIVTGDCSLTATTDGNATLAVTSIPLIITAENKEKCYDGAIFSDAYTATYNGFVNNEDQNALGGTLVFGGTAVTGIVVGNFSIEPSGLTSSNYALDYINGTLVIKATPDAPVITQSNDSLISNVAIGNQWYLDGIAITDANNYVYVVTSNGVYYTVVTQDNCNSDASNSISIITASLIETSNILYDIFPNPNNGVFNIKIKTTSKEVYDIKVYNNLGILIWQHKNIEFDGNNVKNINLNGAIAGAYTLILTNNKDSFVKKLLITR